MLQEILKGRNSIENFIDNMEDEMRRASEIQQYEKAREIRDTLHRLNNLRIKQKMEKVVNRNTEEEYVGIVKDNSKANAYIMTLRRTHGVISDSKKFEFDLIGDNSITTFLVQYYSTAPVIPRFIYVNEDVESKDALETSLERLAEHKVSIIKVSNDYPIREKKQLMDLLVRNISLCIEKGYDPSIVELKNAIHLTTVPTIMDCFDISNFGSSYAVGACTRFINGKPNKTGYRKFKIKTIPNQNDFAMIGEIVTRRYASVTEIDQDQLPDLIVIDGGKGQLQSAIRAIHKLGIDIPCISLAKENEEIFTPFSNKSLILPKRSSALKVLQHIRDESHRFGLDYNANLRKLS
jgi:excinuclease ABC subunit C